MKESEDSFFGRTAYEAYAATAGGKSLITGAELPPFYETPAAVQAGWIAAATAARAAVLPEILMTSEESTRIAREAFERQTRGLPD